MKKFLEVVDEFINHDKEDDMRQEMKT